MCDREKCKIEVNLILDSLPSKRVKKADYLRSYLWGIEMGNIDLMG
jgi:hypothetical protein